MPMRALPVALCALAVAAAAATPPLAPPAAVFYVAPLHGDDNASGTSASMAFRTLGVPSKQRGPPPPPQRSTSFRATTSFLTGRSFLTRSRTATSRGLERAPPRPLSALAADCKAGQEPRGGRGSGVPPTRLAFPSFNSCTTCNRCGRLATPTQVCLHRRYIRFDLCCT